MSVHSGRTKFPPTLFSTWSILIFATTLGGCDEQTVEAPAISATSAHVISRSKYAEKMYGFWLGQSIANWTGLATELDKIGGEGPHGRFYTRDDWGKPDEPNIFSNGVPSSVSPTIDWVWVDEGGIWGSDDDTDIEYIYQLLLLENETSALSGTQIRDGWMTHIYSDENTPFTADDGSKQNFLWVSNQRAHDLMRVQGLVPPATGDPQHNPDFAMIDAQLTTEIFGLFAPGKPHVALEMAHLPIRTTVSGDAALAAEFYVVMHSLAAVVDADLSVKDQVSWLAEKAREGVPETSYIAKMCDYIKGRYEAGDSWEQARDDVYRRYQVEQLDGYDLTSQKLVYNGCFAGGINFAASIVSLLYGEGDYQETVKIAALSGWDSDNPAATWGGLLGFMHGKRGIEKAFDRTFANQFDIHRTRGGFPNDGVDTFDAMAEKGLQVIDRVVREEMQGTVDVEKDQWVIPL